MKFKKDGADVCPETRSDSRSDDSSDNPVVSDPTSGRIDVFCKIDPKATLYIHQLLNEFAKKRGRGIGKKSKITIVVNTRGGEALQGLAIYDLIRSSGLDVMTVVLGEVASSGLVVALAGKKRRMHQNAILHFHRTAMQFDVPRAVVEWDEADRERAQSKVVDDMYAAITLGNSNLTRKELEDLERREAYMTAPEALKAGLIHEIIKHF